MSPKTFTQATSGNELQVHPSPIARAGIRCISCRTEFASVPHGASHCPACGSGLAPQDLRQDVLLPLNWKDLRVLVIWSDEFMRRAGVRGPGLGAYLALIEYIKGFRPENAPGLTLADDVEEARLQGIEMVLVRPREGF